MEWEKVLVKEKALDLAKVTVKVSQLHQLESAEPVQPE
jgi:hypothetical protein